MKDIAAKQSITFDEDELTKIWLMIAESYAKRKNQTIDQGLFSKPRTLGLNIVKDIYSDFHYETRFGVSKISLGSNSDGSEKEISEVYFKKHLIGQHDKSIKYEYLRRILFYVTKKRQTDIFNYLQTKGFIFETDNYELPSGLEYLSGHWIGINRNLEEHKYAVCYYEFKIEGAKMLTKREAYSSEIMYEGEAFLQEDSSFMIHLKGRSKGRIKFIMANPKKIQPDMLKCFASAYSTISPQEPAIVKELLIKLPESVNLSKGKVCTLEQMKKEINLYFKQPYLSLVFDELRMFLGNEEEHVFTLEELTQIKQNDLLPIRKRLKKEKVIENLTASFRINYIGESKKYTRSIVKYLKQEKNDQFIAKYFDEPVLDEYLMTKIVKYSQNIVQTHPIKFKAQTSDGGVDILPLYPFTEDVLSNEKDEPDFRSSNLLIDAYGDTFVSSATVINEFGKTKELSLEIEETTLKTHIVVDFGAIEKVNSSIKAISYHFNEPDEKGGESCLLTVLDKKIRTIKLTGFDKKNKIIQHSSEFNFDPHNSKLFVIIVEFPMYEGDCFCISFDINEN